jgi:hypothetical protein
MHRGCRGATRAELQINDRRPRRSLSDEIRQASARYYTRHSSLDLIGTVKDVFVRRFARGGLQISK